MTAVLFRVPAWESSMPVGEFTVCSSQNLVIGREALEPHLRTVTLESFQLYVFSMHPEDANLLPPRTVFSRTWEISLWNANIQRYNSLCSAPSPVGALLWLVPLSQVKDMRNLFLLWDKHQLTNSDGLVTWTNPLTTPWCLSLSVLQASRSF